MRAPGDSIGTFALESAMDELARELGMDPIELRRTNEPDKDPTSGLPFSNRHLLEAYARGAERFGWSARSPEPRTQRSGKWLIGQGVASAYYPYYRFPASAKLTLFADGTAQVQAAAHETGMGTATVQIQHVAQRLGLPVDRVRFGYGDSTMPITYLAGGSSQTASLVAAVSATITELHKALPSSAPWSPASTVQARAPSLRPRRGQARSARSRRKRSVRSARPCRWLTPPPVSWS